MPSIKDKTRLELVIQEAMQPILGVLDQMKTEIRETLGITDAPWKIFNLPYNELSDEQIMVLFEVYHIPGEEEPCPMCKWSLRRELQELNAEKI